ncbi:MAG: peptidylprolyl isomerase [Bryobacterales bacterium]|nr:peptidylprolyl isomerase [Bryobacteraceae bacterium]MDW8129780.1 peptidylprolyl isomerase [Bryobacterales bacterium]
MAQAKFGDTVRVHYTGRLDDGTVFDSSLRSGPLEFTIGDGQLIPGFENAVIGMTPGETKTQKIPAEDAYGPHADFLVIEVDRRRVPPDLDPKVGDRLQLQHPDGRVTPVLVTAVTESSITLDANHPLAGKDLTFDIELLEILQEEGEA